MAIPELNRNKKWLQRVLVVLGLIPLVSGALCILGGAQGMPGGMAINSTVDGELRFLGGIWFGFGLILYSIIPKIETETMVFRLLIASIFAGGIGRLISIANLGFPHPFFLGPLFIELILAPTLIVWQKSIASSKLPSK